MALFSKEQIDNFRNYLQRNGYPELHSDLGQNRKFDYFLVSQEENPALPNFAIAMRTKNLADGTLFGVSSFVDPRFRPYWVGHEFMETVELEPDTPNKCLITLEKELILVPEDIKPDYIPKRLKFFQDLIAFAQVRNYAPEDIKNFKQSLSRLEKLARQF